MSLVLGTAGHIDHGKSALVKALTGTDPDRLKEEQARGITIDLGFAHTTIGELTVAFVDVPGHERFVRNMLAGAGGIDAVLLVVAADESVMPQTREHFEICRLLGIERGVIALTKSDLAEGDMLDVAALEARDLVAGSFLAGAPIVPVSARTGAGLDDLRRTLAALGAGRRRETRSRVVRLPIDRVFTVKGFGTVVTGTLVSGAVAEGDALRILPHDRPVRVRGIQVHGNSVKRIDAPSRAALNLSGADVGELERGLTLATQGSFAVTRRFDARLELIAGARPLRHGMRVRVHHGTAEIPGRVAIAAARDRQDEAWRPAMAGEAAVEVRPGGEAYVQLRLDRPAVLTRGDRVVLRAWSPPATIGGATVLDPEPPARGLRRAAVFRRFGQIDDATAEAFARVVIAEAGERGVEAGELVRRGGLDPERASAVLGDLIEARQAVAGGDRVFSPEVLAGSEARLLRQLADFHRAHPLEPGMPREALRSHVVPDAPLEFFETVLAAAIMSGTISSSADRVALKGHRPSADAQDAREVILRLTLESGLAPPDTVSLQGQSGLSPADFNAVVNQLVREQKLVRIGSFCFHPEVLGGMRSEIQKLKTGAAAAAIDVAMFKERYKLTRKHAIPLLEWLDRERVTRRVGEKRIVL
jgi:selenocysteine-specific elongation factor